MKSLPTLFLIFFAINSYSQKKESIGVNDSVSKKPISILNLASKDSTNLQVSDTLSSSVFSQVNKLDEVFINSKSEFNAVSLGILKKEIQAILVDAPQDTSYVDYELPAGHKPHVILVVGVNGAGKTTTIGKLAHNFSLAGKSVLLGAADTFRAAAVDQLNIWSERTNVPIVKHPMGSDPSAVAFDAVQSGVARNADVIIIDTAGRLHNKIHLMDELNKIKRSVNKAMPGAPHEVMLVLDGSTGQNALEQAKHFTAATEVTALTITKLDGTAKGGVVLAIADQFKIPVKFIGVGEQATDLLVFDKRDFVESLFGGVEKQ